MESIERTHEKKTYQVRKLLQFRNGAFVPQTTSQIEIMNQVTTELSKEQKERRSSPKQISYSKSITSPKDRSFESVTGKKGHHHPFPSSFSFQN